MRFQQRLAKWEKQSSRQQPDRFQGSGSRQDDMHINLFWPLFSHIWPLQAAAKLPDHQLKKRLDQGIRQFESARRRDLLKDQVDEAPAWCPYKPEWWGLWKSPLDFMVFYLLRLREGSPQEALQVARKFLTMWGFGRTEFGMMETAPQNAWQNCQAYILACYEEEFGPLTIPPPPLQEWHPDHATDAQRVAWMKCRLAHQQGSVQALSQAQQDWLDTIARQEPSLLEEWTRRKGGYACWANK